MGELACVGLLVAALWGYAMGQLLILAATDRFGRWRFRRGLDVAGTWEAYIHATLRNANRLRGRQYKP